VGGIRQGQVLKVFEQLRKTTEKNSPARSERGPEEISSEHPRNHQKKAENV